MSNDVSFNLMGRQWIPGERADGSEIMLSIKDAFRQSDRIRRLSGDNPIQEFALLRLLLAIMYGALGDDFTKEDWQAMLEAGPSGEHLAKLLEYCDRYEPRFDLFDGRQPFFQVADLHTDKGEVKSLDTLVTDMPSGNTVKLFTHRGAVKALGADEAARWLVTCQAIDYSGIKSGAAGDPRAKNGKGYPIGTGWAGTLGGIALEGSNLWQTLMLNFCSGRVNDRANRNGVAWTTQGALPWERPQDTACATEGYDQPADADGTTLYFHSPATLYTWQSRRIRLFHDGETVTDVLICNGDRLKPQNAQYYEPMSAWRRSDAQEKKLKMAPVFMPRKHDPSRALWRNLPTLTTITGNQDVAKYLQPLTLQWLKQVKPHNVPVRLHAYGVEYGSQEAVIDTTVDDILDLQLAILTSTDKRTGNMIEASINLVDKGVNALADLARHIAIAGDLDVDSACSHARDMGFSAFDNAYRQWVRTVDVNNLPASYATWQATVRRILMRLANDLANKAPSHALVGREKAKKDESGNAKSRHYSVASGMNFFIGTLNTIVPAPRERNQQSQKGEA